MIENLRRKRRDIRWMNECLPLAERLAAADGVEEGGAEYLVLAALALDEGSAARAFTAVDLEPTDFAAAVEAAHADALASIGVTARPPTHAAGSTPRSSHQRGPLRSGPTSHRLFRATIDEVRAADQPLSGAAVLAAACRAALDPANHSTTSRALRRLDVDLVALESAARIEAAAAGTD